MSIFIQKTFGVMFCSAVIVLQPFCQRNSYWVKVSAPVTIGAEWLEIQPNSPLRAEKDLQWVVLVLEFPFKYDHNPEGNGPERGKGILMPDGEVINPEIEIIDQNGNKFTLVWQGAREGSPAYSLRYPSELPRDREYKTIESWSPKPIKCKGIYWFCESIKDWK